MAQTIAGVNIAISADTAALIRETAKASKAIEQNTRQMATSFQRVETVAARAQRAVIGATAGFLTLSQAAQAARAIQQYSDAWQEAGNKIAASAQIAGVQARSLSKLTDMANEVRAPIAVLTDLYSKLLRVSTDVGLSENQVAQATETVAKAFKAAGASTLEYENGVRQLAQALGSGILQGDELRSLRENAPLLAKAIAKEFDTTVAGLKELGARGELEAGRVAQAIIKGQADIDAAFSKTNATIGDSFTILENAFMKYLGGVNDSTGANTLFANSVIAVANHLPALAQALINVIPGLNMWVAAMRAAKEAKDALLPPGATMAATGGVGSGLGNAAVLARQARMDKISDSIIRGDGSKGASGGGGRGPGGGAPILEAAAEFRAYEEAAKAAKTAEDEWATSTSVTDHFRTTHEALQSIPDMLESVMTPLDQYREKMNQIAIAEQYSAEVVAKSFELRRQALLGLVGEGLNAVGNLVGAFSQLFRENKALAVASAIINTAEGITKALAQGGMFGWVNAAAIAVAGAAQVSTILSTQPGSSKAPSVKGGAKSGKSGGGGGGAVESAGEASRGNKIQQSITLHIEGDVFGPEHFRKMIKGINGAVQDGTVLLRVT